MNYFVRLFEDVDLKYTANKKVIFKNEETGKVEVEDISNFIFSRTNGGTEPVTLYGVRTNDSKTDPSKKAGDPMVINGKMKFKYEPTGTPSHLGDAKHRYSAYDTITLAVNSVDGKKYPPKSYRHIKLNNIRKIAMGGETYNILR